MQELVNTDVLVCYHCGETCKDEEVHYQDKKFCCEGCKLVFQILEDNNLCTYYELDDKAGISLKGKHLGEQYAYLDNQEIIRPLFDFQSETLSKVTLKILSIHCSSCIWLLENLYRLREGVLASRVNFFKKELALSFHPGIVSLREIVELLATVGYAPDINLQDKEEKKQNKASQSIFIKLGVVGFCTGNIMLLSFPEYFGLEETVDSMYRSYFIWLNVILSLPVFFYGGMEYFKPAYQALKKRVINIDVPVSIGIITLFSRSLYETLAGTSPGYWDSLSGLIFFLLIGKWLQNKTYQNLAFDRNYKSYFPLAASVIKDGKEVSVPVNQIDEGDQIAIRNRELIPADSILISSDARIDYSFVTGESEPLDKKKGDYIYAGGRQVGTQIVLEVEKPVSQSYLTQLWNNEVFAKDKETVMTRLASDFSRYFTYITLSLAVVTALYWYFADPSVMWNAFTAVLIIACPCALSLSMPFTMENTMRIFGKNGIYVKNPTVIQHLATIDHIVFDKTGTLTAGNNSDIAFFKGKLSKEESVIIKSLAIHSTHPLSRKISRLFEDLAQIPVTSFKESVGKGIEGMVGENSVRIGSMAFIGLAEKISTEEEGQEVFISINNEFKGYFVFANSYREGFETVLTKLKKRFKLSLLSGDHPVDLPLLSPLFGSKEHMLFEQRPMDKLKYIKNLQDQGKKVLMIGDGLNDAGALKQSDVGMVLTDDVHAFFPACDILSDAKRFNRLFDIIRFSRTSVNIVKASFVFSMIYNVIGLTWAISGNLSPIFAAILMPVSSISVVGFAVGLSSLFAEFKKL